MFPESVKHGSRFPPERTDLGRPVLSRVQVISSWRSIRAGRPIGGVGVEGGAEELKEGLKKLLG